MRARLFSGFPILGWGGVGVVCNYLCLLLKKLPGLKNKTSPDRIYCKYATNSQREPRSTTTLSDCLARGQLLSRWWTSYSFVRKRSISTSPSIIDPQPPRWLFGSRMEIDFLNAMLEQPVYVGRCVFPLFPPLKTTKSDQANSGPL